jgi:molecular chaperone HtpG
MRRYRDVPLEVIPVEIEEPVRARGALYISDRRLPDLNTAGVVDLFVRRMFVRGSDAELLPEWAKFIRGIIECPDLQPTAARDNVRRSGWAYTALRQRLSELIVSRLAFLATDRPERFKQINRWHHYHLKGMAVFHQDFFEQVGGLLLFDTNRGLMSLAGVFGDVEAVDEATEEEPWRASVQSRAATQFYRLADARGWTVVNAGRAFERELLVRYASSHGAAHRLVPLDAAHGQALFAPPSTAARDRIRELERDIEAALRSDGLDNVAVHVCRFAPASLPAIVLLSPDSEAELTLEDLVRQPWFAESLGDVTREVLSQRERRPLHLRLNEENDLVRRLLDAGPSLDGSEDVYWGLFLSAALNAQDLLTETTTTTLHRQLLRLLGSAVDSRRLARTERALDGGDES